MSTMSYCRFQNTARDLQDCWEHMDETKLSADERRARRSLVRLCRNISEDYTDDDGRLIAELNEPSPTAAGISDDAEDE